jgi:hypothetical protein
MAVQLAPGSLRGASGRCHAKTAQRAESVAVTSHCSVPYVTSAFPLRASCSAANARLDVRPGTRKQHLWWVFLDQASHSAIADCDAPSHMHLWS